MKFKSEFTNELVQKYGLQNILCKHGHRINKGHNKCFQEGRVHPSTNSRILNQTKCKILLYDIETSPILALVWGIWEQNVNISAILEDWHVISWSAKWLFSDEVMGDSLNKSELSTHNDERIVRNLWELLNEADVVVGHNSISFDNKRMNTRFLKYGIPPTLPFISVDTLQVAKNVFGFTSNKLDYINTYLGLPVKTPTDFDLWKREWDGDLDAVEALAEYNKNDVVILEDLFLRLRPYIRGLPNLNLWNTESVTVCPSCGSVHLDWTVKAYYTHTGMYKGFRCEECGAVGRSRYTALSVEKRKTVVRSS